MMKEIFQRLFSRHQKTPFSTWQIELTTRCPLKCKMCVREGSRDWQSGDMHMDDFEKLIPYFKDVERVALEGEFMQLSETVQRQSCCPGLSLYGMSKSGFG